MVILFIHQGTQMKTIEISLLVAFFLGFIALLITGMFTQSIPLLLLAFVVAFLGYAMCEHTT